VRIPIPLVFLAALVLLQVLHVLPHFASVLLAGFAVILAVQALRR
jgi:hypothetical protein